MNLQLKKTKTQLYNILNADLVLYGASATQFIALQHEHIMISQD